MGRQNSARPTLYVHGTGGGHCNPESRGESAYTNRHLSERRHPSRRLGLDLYGSRSREDSGQATEPYEKVLTSLVDNIEHVESSNYNGESVVKIFLQPGASLPSRCANWLMAKLSGVNIHHFGTTFKPYRRELLSQLPLSGEMHPFIPALAWAYGASICEIPIQNKHWKHGVSH